MLYEYTFFLPLQPPSPLERMDHQIFFHLQHPSSSPLPKPTQFNKSLHEDGNNTCLCGAFQLTYCPLPILDMYHFIFTLSMFR